MRDKTITSEHSDDFYETMPLYQSEEFAPADAARITAIITLIFVAIAALLLGILFIQGLSAVQNAVPAPVA